MFDQKLGDPIDIANATEFRFAFILFVENDFQSFGPICRTQIIAGRTVDGAEIQAIFVVELFG